MKKTIHILIVLTLCLCLAIPALAGDDGTSGVKLAKEPAKLAKDVEGGLDYLFKTLADKDARVDPAQFGAVLEMATNGPADPKDIAPARRFGGKGICLRTNINASLETVMRYFYNKDIPNFLLCPAVLRLSGWHEGSEFLQAPALWEALPTLAEPVQVRGREFEVCTPDSFGEAYFRYDLDRLLTLLKYQGKNVLVSVSMQDEKSDIGRKGAILSDKEWEYFYSGIEGLNKGGLSWMDTFMYKSGSVIAFVEQEPGKTSLFLFKWLKAGWAGLNVVKRTHIYDGSLRYARSLMKVMESSTLSPEELVAGMQDVARLSQADRDDLITQYAKNFEVRFKSDPKLKKKEYAKLIANGGYAKVLNKDDRQSILALEKLKAMLGMETLINMASPVAQAPAKTEAVKAEVQPEG